MNEQTSEIIPQWAIRLEDKIDTIRQQTHQTDKRFQNYITLTDQRIKHLEERCDRLTQYLFGIGVTVIAVTILGKFF